MGTWGLLACGFFVGVSVGQLTLALLLGLFRKDRAEAVTDLLNVPAAGHDTLLIVTPNRH